MSQRVARSFLLSLLTTCAVAVAPGIAAAASFTVNSDADPGDGTCDVTECTLREALTAANGTAAADTIGFSISGGFGGTIFLGSALPAISQPVTIDGTTDPGYAAPAPDVVLDGSNLVSGNGLDVGIAGVTIKGLSIVGFPGDGIHLGASGATVQANYIGTTDTFSFGPNAGAGISIAGSTNTIGGVAAGQANTILGNTGAGVLVSSGTGNVIRGNSIDANGGLGIDLAPGGVTANDAGDADAGANDLQNFPVLTSASSSGGTTTIQGSLSSASSASFTVDFYSSPGCDSSGNGEGSTWLGSAAANTNAGGTATINAALSVTPPAGDRFVSATATNAANSTSEFSGSVPLGGSGITPQCTALPVAQALAADPAQVTGASWVALPPSGTPNAVATTALGSFPTDGSSYAILTSGDATQAPTGGNSSNSDGGPSVRGNTDFDVSVLKVDLNVPAAANCLTIDFRFLSAEYPTYVGTSYNDAFIAELDSSTWTTSGSTITAANNFAFDPSHDVISINSTGATAMTAGDAAGTSYGGATPLLHASTPLTSGAHSLYLSIFDQGDHVLDSAVFLDKLLLSTKSPAACQSGATADNTPPIVTLDTPANASTTSDSTPTYSGTAGTLTGDLAGITVKIYSGATATGSPLQTLTTNAVGSSYTVDGTTPLPAGTYTAQAEQSDSSGNTGFSSANTFTVAAPQAGVTDTSHTEGNAGTSNMTFNVTLSGPSSQTITVHYATTDGTAQQPGDYTSTSGTLTFNPGVTTLPVDVPIVGDTADEQDETLTLTLSAPSNATLDASHTTATGTILDDDGPAVSIDDQQVTEGDSGTQSMTFHVTIPSPSVQDVSVHYATSDASAVAPGDYTAGSGTATITAGQTSTNVVVPIVGDLLDENDETLHVDLSAPVHGSIADNLGVGTITDNDAAPALSVDDQSANEGNSGTSTMTFNATLSAASAKTITVAFATSDGTATAGSDYAATSGTLTFAPGVTSQPIPVTINGDTAVEPDETFKVDLTSPSNASVADAQGIGTIKNDDATTVPPVVPALSIGDATVNPEGNSGTTPATFTVHLSAATTVPVTVTVTTANGTATSPADFAGGSGPLTFAPGDTSKTVPIAVVGDTLDEADETFTVNLTTPVNATIADGSGLGTIIDDDLAPVVLPPVVDGSGLFCGTQHRGKCKGLPVKGVFDRPGNASWTFGAYNPSPGGGSTRRARTAASKVLALGTVKRKVTKAGTVSFVFKLKKGARTKALLRKVKKGKMGALRVTETFVPVKGPKATTTKTIKLRYGR